MVHRARARLRLSLRGPRLPQLYPAAAATRDRRDGECCRRRDERRRRITTRLLVLLVWGVQVRVRVGVGRSGLGERSRCRRRPLRRDDNGTAREDVELVLVFGFARLDVPQRAVVHGRGRRVVLRALKRAVRLLSQPEKDRL